MFPLYLKRMQVKKVVNTVKKSFISLDPPPEPSSVVVVKRKYSSLARDLKYKKRVTWFDISPELPVAVVEYIGSYPTNTNVHGNAKHISAPYRRTTSQQKIAILTLFLVHELFTMQIMMQIKRIIQKTSGRLM